jgi:predicted transcriptional regulator
MEQKEVLAVKVTKEIVVKFIEVGRLSVNSFEEVWKQVHQAVSNSLKKTKS